MGLKLAYQDGNELFLIINNDNRLGESNLKYLMRIFIDNNLDILGSIVVFKNDLIKHYGVTFNPNNGKIIHNLSTQNINNIYFSQEFIKTDSLGGQGVLINRNVIT